MPIIFIRFILPVLVFIGIQIKLSAMYNKWLGLIIPAICITLTIILSANALESLGTIFALCIMFIPNLLSITIYILTRKYMKKKDQEVIMKKFPKK
ncbi:MAG: hypothetical protein R3Y12_06800 [Clostridia bacterium]